MIAYVAVEREYQESSRKLEAGIAVLVDLGPDPQIEVYVERLLGAASALERILLCRESVAC